MDGVAVGLGAKFVVDGERCDHPGDSSLSPRNRTNCRCDLFPVQDHDQLTAFGPTDITRQARQVA